MYEENDTVLKNKSNAEPKASETANGNPSFTPKRSLGSEALRMAVAALVGAGAGISGMWASKAFAGNPADATETKDADAQAPKQAEAPAEEKPAEKAAPEKAEPEKTASEESSSKETGKAAQEQSRHTAPKTTEHTESSHEVHHNNDQPHPVPASEQHSIEIGEVEEYIDSEGNTVRLASGKVDGHDAVFHVDSQNHVLAAAVDVNDNGHYESDEVVDLRSEGLTIGGNGVTPVSDDSQEVRVISVEENVDLDGQPVNVAHIAMGDDEAVLVDATQNGEVDFVVHDDNYNGSIDDGEVHDVTDSHIPMPQMDDVDSIDGHLAQTDDLPDYSNDADITMYEA